MFLSSTLLGREEGISFSVQKWSLASAVPWGDGGCWGAPGNGSSLAQPLGPGLSCAFQSIPSPESGQRQPLPHPPVFSLHPGHSWWVSAASAACPLPSARFCVPGAWSMACPLGRRRSPGSCLSWSVFCGRNVLHVPLWLCKPFGARRCRGKPGHGTSELHMC